MMPLTAQTEVGPAGFVALCWSKRRAQPEHMEEVKMKFVYALESRTGLVLLHRWYNTQLQCAQRGGKGLLLSLCTEV